MQISDKKTTKNLDYIKENYFSNPKECNLILENTKVEELSIEDSAYYYKYCGLKEYYAGNFFYSYQKFQKSLRVGELNNMVELIDTISLNLSAVLLAAKQYTKAISYCFRASRSKNERVVCNAYQNLSMNYGILNDFEKALYYNNKAIELAHKMNKPNLCFPALVNSGSILAKLGEKVKALKYFKRALKLALDDSTFRNVSDAYLNLSLFYNDNSQFENAIENANLALEYAKENAIARMSPNIYYVLINSYFCLNNKKLTQHYLNIYESLSNSFVLNYSQAQIFDLKIKIEEKNNNLKGAIKIAKEKMILLKSKEEEELKKFNSSIQFAENENKQIIKINTKLNQSNNELINIAKILAHDIKTPIRTISSFSRLLKTEIQETNNQKADEYLNFITGAATDLYKKLELSLDLILLNLNFPLKPIKLNAIIFELKNKFEKLKIITQHPLPTIWSNKEIMMQFFISLFENAQFFNASKIPELTLNIKEKGNRIIFKFIDNGIGIPEDQESKVFELFNTSREKVKQGVGLSICKKICELHGGKIRVTSNKGKGTIVIAEMLKRVEHIQIDA